MRRILFTFLLATLSTAADTQDLAPDRPGRAVLAGTPARPLTDPRSLDSTSLPGARAVPLTDVLSLRSSYFATWTPDGRDIVFDTDLTGRPNLWRTSSTGGFPEQIQQSEDRAYYSAVSPDGKTVYYASDSGGREIYDIFAVPLNGGEPVNLTNSPEATDIGPMRFSRDGRSILFLRRAKTESSVNVGMLDVVTHQVRLLTQEKQADMNWTPVGFTPDGKRVIANRADLGMTTSTIWSIDVATGAMKKLAGTEKGYDWANALSSDGRFLSATRENAAGVNEAVLIDVATGRHIVMMPEQWPSEGRAISPDDKTVLILSNVDGSGEISAYDVASGRARKLDLPSGLNSDYQNIGVLPAFSPDGRRLLLPSSSGSAPFDYWTYDLASGARTKITDLGLASVKAEGLPKSQIVTYASADGTPISALLWLPYNLKRDASAPVVVIAHGGPIGQTENAFNPTAIALASRGYIVMAPNVRGSSGYGRAFAAANYQDLGGRDLEDEAWAAKFAIASGYADPKKIGITGASYGGYMTLIALGRMPDFWAAGVDEYGMVNWSTMWEHASPPLRVYLRGVLGDPAVDVDVFKRTNPSTYLPQVKAPLLILQGQNDIRSPASEAQQVVDYLKRAGETVDAKIYPEEGHGFAKRENQIDALQRLVSWFDTYLKSAK